MTSPFKPKTCPSYIDSSSVGWVITSDGCNRLAIAIPVHVDASSNSRTGGSVCDTASGSTVLASASFLSCSINIRLAFGWPHSSFERCAIHPNHLGNSVKIDLTLAIHRLPNIRHCHHRSSYRLIFPSRHRCAYTTFLCYR